MKPLESPNLQNFFLENKLENAPKDTLNMKILLLDDDVVVQKDLTGHWEIDMNRKVNGGCRDLCRFVPLVCSRGQLLKADPYLGLREGNITFPTES
ncbi:hypothetical protein YC2023_037413 [Brassica napus]